MNPNRDYFKDGEAFEKFVQDVVFPASHFKLLEKTHDYEQNAARYVESSLKPDFKFRSIATGKEFYVEVKFRSRYNKNDRLELFKPNQLERYKSYDTPAQPVFLLVGTEGYPNRPKFLSLIPIREIEHLELYQSVIYRHRIPMGICPENALTSLPKINPSPAVSPGLRDIASGLTYKRPSQKRMTYLPWILGFLVVGIFLAFFMTQSSSADSPPSTAVSLKDKVQEYYHALELNNTEVMNYYLHDRLDRWYEHNNVSLTFVKRDAEKYNKKYPYRQIDIDWASYKEHVLPNGDISLSYNVNYQIKSKTSAPYKTYHLAIKSIWSPEHKIKSMYEVKLE